MVINWPASRKSIAIHPDDRPGDHGPTAGPGEPATGAHDRLAASPDVTVRPQESRRRVGSVEVFCAILVAAVAVRVLGVDPLPSPTLRVAATVFVAVCVQALPFLVLGVLLSGLLAAVVSPALLRRALPRRPGLAVPVAAASGAVLPGCECASVPVARRLIARGVPDGAALAFLLAAPAINPVVLVSTAVAFPGHPEMVAARFAGSAATAVGTGWLWTRLGRPPRLPAEAPAADRAKWAVFAAAARHDLLDAIGFLVLGGLAAATLTVLVPAQWQTSLAGHAVAAIAVMALLAVVLALCSEADAFVAASLSALPLLPRLVFLVVGPAVDVKLIALQVGTFGRAFTARFAPLAFAVAVVAAVASGLVLL